MLARSALGGAKRLPFVHFAVIDSPPEEQRWLVEGMWPSQGTGILGGDPKLGKSVLAAELAVAVATGMPFLGRFHVPEPGAVLVCSMEGPRWLAADRTRKILAHRAPGQLDAPIHLLDTATLRLDEAGDLEAMRDAVADAQPKLLILDPLVRLHALDENAVGGMSRLLNELRVLQREFETSILLVHHNRKNVARSARPGTGLRGSSDLYAWGDVGWFVRSDSDRVSLTVEHRTAPSPPPMCVRLEGDAESLHFELLDDLIDEVTSAASGSGSIANDVLAILTANVDGVGFGEIRRQLKVGASKVSETLKDLAARGEAAVVGRQWFRTVPPAPPVEPRIENGTEHEEVHADDRVLSRA